MAINPTLLFSSPTEAFGQIVEKRRSVYSYLATPVPRSVIDWAIGLAMLAPNHHKTRPWRFFVFADAGLDQLATAYEHTALRLGRDVARARKRAYDAPVMITVACIPALGNPKVKAAEEEFATAAAAQNLMLGLASAGLATLLTTGDLVESPELRAAIGMEGSTGKIMGVINVGFQAPDRPLPPRPAPDPATYTKWITA
jgi:nitroreductase